MRPIFNILFFLSSALYASSSVEYLYRRLDPSSLSSLIAFYELYPETEEGFLALKKARQLFAKSDNFPVEKLFNRINRFGETGVPDFSDEELTLIETLSARMPNRKLKGFYATTEEELIALPDEEIDVGKALLITEGKEGRELRRYAAFLDLMALSINAKLPMGSATNEEKINAINDFLFSDKRYRFPPHSIYEKKIERFTFLSSVIEGHLGVCLGVSSLYLAMAERIGLPLEIVTPPGHIYLRCRNPQTCRVIETTARGRDVPEEHYWNVNMCVLHERSKKEVIGLVHINSASVFLQDEKGKEALQEYEKAKPYLQNDAILKELTAYAYLLNNEKEKGEKLLKEVINSPDLDKVAPETFPYDYLAKTVDEEGIRAVLMPVTEKRESLKAKEKTLKATLNRFPKFREGYHQLASILLEQHRNREALECLEKFHALDPNHPTVEYFLAELYAEREDFNKAWLHLHRVEKLISGKENACRKMSKLRQRLLFSCPEI